MKKITIQISKKTEDKINYLLKNTTANSIDLLMERLVESAEKEFKSKGRLT